MDRPDAVRSAPTLMWEQPVSDFEPVRSSTRPIVESLIVLLLGVILFRSFAAEAYIVPTGSMAPTLLGNHREFSCDHCAMRFVVGVDEDGRSGRPVCSNCGSSLDEPRVQSVWRGGDRLLVQKHFFEWRPPRRWEVIVFQNPHEAGQAYVKRVVGLPGESVWIKDGNVSINGRIARKTLSEQRAMRILVHDNDFQPAASDWFPRWTVQRSDGGPSGWSVDGAHLRRSRVTSGDQELLDWVEYRHLDPARRNYGPVRDFTSYNGGDVAGNHRVDDLMLETDLRLSDDVATLILQFRQGGDRYLVRIPRIANGLGLPIVERNGVAFEREWADPNARQRLQSDRTVRLEASFFDRRVLVAVDGALLFEPFDDDQPRGGPELGPRDSPLALGVQGGEAELRRVRVYRDLYYTGSLAYAPHMPFGIEAPFQLEEGEYFVLGDNSPVSNDSRFWPERPVVRAEMLLGKPFLVHLPSRGIPLRVFGGEPYWVPDPREIRYIR